MTIPDAAVFVVADDALICDSLAQLVKSVGLKADTSFYRSRLKIRNFLTLSTIPFNITGRQDWSGLK